MAEVVFRPVTDGQCKLENSNVDYFTARNAAEASEASSYPVIGQRLLGELYYIFRSGFCFDTSGLDDSCLIQSATLWLYATVGCAIGDIMIKNGMPTYPHIPAVVGDYYRTLYSGNGGIVTTTTQHSITIPLNYTGLSWINKTGNTKFMIMSQNDIDGIAPTGNEYISITTGGDDRPKLTVVYTIPTGTPAVGNASFSGTKDTFTIATANVSDDGGGYEERGFEYGFSEEPTWKVSETGVFTGTGNFSLVISGLKPSTIYYARAYVTNAYGTTYSDEWTSFTTGVSPSYGMYEESNAATICFYVRQVGGKWSQKFGPYTTDQADIEITKILTEGKGKYQIKFESDVLTGISAGVMVKIDIKAR